MANILEMANHRAKWSEILFYPSTLRPSMAIFDDSQDD